MPQDLLVLGLFAISITINSAMWYRMGKLDARFQAIEKNIVTRMDFKNGDFKEKQAS